MEECTELHLAHGGMVANAFVERTWGLQLLLRRKFENMKRTSTAKMKKKGAEINVSFLELASLK
jgi:hypothetical protein